MSAHIEKSIMLHAHLRLAHSTYFTEQYYTPIFFKKDIDKMRLETRMEYRFIFRGKCGQKINKSEL